MSENAGPDFRAEVLLFRAVPLTAQDRQDAATRARWVEGVLKATCAHRTSQTAALNLRITASDQDAAKQIAREAARSTGLSFDSLTVRQPER